jgi:hypothetical protein
MRVLCYEDRHDHGGDELTSSTIEKCNRTPCIVKFLK